jgi:hypothetical protein
MKKGAASKTVVFFLSVSFLIMMNGFQKILAEAKDMELPIGQMISEGVVKFEARENIWKEVEPSHFPIFRGTRVKVEEGVAFITLSNRSQIEVGPNSLCSFDHTDRFILSRGGIKFRVPAELESNFEAGNLSMQKSRTFQAAKGSSISTRKDEGAIGSISIHSNGSTSMRSIQGKFSILNQDRVPLAVLSAKQQVTVPSRKLESAPKVRVTEVKEEGMDGHWSHNFGGHGDCYHHRCRHRHHPPPPCPPHCR